MNLDIGLMTFDLQAVPAYARRAEDMGFGAIWSAETRHDPFLPLAVASTTTSRVGLGTAIAVAFPRSPTVIAHIAWDLTLILVPLTPHSALSPGADGPLAVRPHGVQPGPGGSSSGASPVSFVAGSGWSKPAERRKSRRLVR